MNTRGNPGGIFRGSFQRQVAINRANELARQIDSLETKPEADLREWNIIVQMLRAAGETDLEEKIVCPANWC
jgi:hypothetical protein